MQDKWNWRGEDQTSFLEEVMLEISPEYSLEGLMLKLKLQHWPPDAKN